MDAHVNEWLNLLVRWLHVITGIAWIGSSFFFMWLDRSLSRATKKGVEGELWMVHSGGFYHVEKKLVTDWETPQTLHWFKYEALFTWISGFFLLCIVYYLTDGIYLLDPSTATLTAGQASALGIGLLVVSWFVYDGLWISPLSRSKSLTTAICLVLLVVITYSLTHVLSGRAAFLHVGAMLGTLMVANVWVRIIPAQKQLVAATQGGASANPQLAKSAKTRSVHNNYMTLPVVFIMLSHHFPSTYGHHANWVMLLGLMLSGAMIRHTFNVRSRWNPALWGTSTAIIALLFWFTSPWSTGTLTGAEVTSQDRNSATPLHPSKENAATSPNASANKLTGIVRFSGNAPTPQKLNLTGDCARLHSGPIMNESLVINNNRIANAVVSIKKGGALPKSSTTHEVTLDQRGCLYTPHVLAVQTGQPVTILNSDSFLHNVHSRSSQNPSFNDSLSGKGTKRVKVFSKPELSIQTNCDVHPWMRAYIAVFDHSYFSVTDSTGSFSITALPPGTHTVEVWHESLGRQEKDVTIVEGKDASLEFSFEGKK